MCRDLNFKNTCFVSSCEFLWTIDDIYHCAQFLQIKDGWIIFSMEGKLLFFTANF